MLYKPAVSLLTLLLAASFSYVRGKSNVEELSGVIVAYPDVIAWSPCYKDCNESLIVRVDTAEGKPSYIRLDVHYRDGRYPKKLIQTNARWLLRVVRTPRNDEPLYQFVTQAANRFGPEKRWPLWLVISTGEKLPFEQTIASYSLIGFKQARRP